MSQNRVDYIRVHGIGQKTTKQYEDQFLKPIPGTLQEGGAGFQTTHWTKVIAARAKRVPSMLSPFSSSRTNNTRSLGVTEPDGTRKMNGSTKSSPSADDGVTLRKSVQQKTTRQDPNVNVSSSCDQSESTVERRDVIVVASVSCIYGLGSPDAYYDMLAYLTVGDRSGMPALLSQLVEMQYERTNLDLARGNFRVRGGVVEIHPAYEDMAVRVEYFGDEIEKITRTDPLRGTALERLDRLHPKMAVERLHREVPDRLVLSLAAERPDHEVGAHSVDPTCVHGAVWVGDQRAEVEHEDLGLQRRRRQRPRQRRRRRSARSPPQSPQR